MCDEFWHSTGVVTERPHLRADHEVLLDAIRSARDADIVVVTGSSSVGAADGGASAT